MRKADLMCALCRDTIFWAEAGYWLHMHPIGIHEKHEPEPNTAVLELKRIEEIGPCEWNAWNEEGEYFYLRYRRGVGKVTKQPDGDPKTWTNTGEEIIRSWNDHTDANDIALSDFLERAAITLDSE